jgi:hypothetical protein
VPETLRCNICNSDIDVAQVKDHAATKQHAELKSKLEQNLSKTKKKEYVNDVSIVLKWSESA